MYIYIYICKHEKFKHVIKISFNAFIYNSVTYK